MLALQGVFIANEVTYLEAVAAVGILCLVAWAGMIVTINEDEDTITRRLFFFRGDTYKLADITEMREVSDADTYGTHKFMQLRFKDGAKWNLAMFSKNDVKGIMNIIHAHAAAT